MDGMKLGDYLALKKIPRAHFARQIKKSPATVTLYCKGDIRPPGRVAEVIAIETDGNVMPNDFLVIPAIAQPQEVPACS
jgi:hypothetical protein